MILYDEDLNIVSHVRFEEGSNEWDLALNLYEEARRFVTGWDVVLEDIESAVKGREPIGFPPKPQPAPEGEDDIPF